MYIAAPRCSIARLATWVLAGSRPSCPPAANAGAQSSRPARKTAKCRSGEVALVMRGHSLRHRLGLLEAEVRIDEEEDEIGEIDDGEDAPDHRFHRIRARTATDLAQPDETEREQAQRDLVERAAETPRTRRRAIQPG